MKRPRAAVAVAAVLGIVALLAVPGYATYRQVTDDPTGKTYARAYDLVEATVPSVKVDRKQTREGTIAREGGGDTAFQCARITAKKGGATGWACVGLAPDGRSGSALWFSEKPSLDGAQFLIGDRKALTRPE